MPMSRRPRMISTIPRILVLEPDLPDCLPRSLTWRTGLFGNIAITEPMATKRAAKTNAEVGLPDMGAA